MIARSVFASRRTVINSTSDRPGRRTVSGCCFRVASSGLILGTTGATSALRARVEATFVY